MAFGLNPYSELQITSNFSFLQGASHPEEFAEQAALLGYKAIAITDRNTLAGVVRAHIAAKEKGIQLVVGSRVEAFYDSEIQEGAESPKVSLLLYPTDRKSYGALCTLLSIGNLRAQKGENILTLDEVLERSKGMLITVVPPFGNAPFLNAKNVNFYDLLKKIRSQAPDPKLLSVAVTRNYLPGEERQIAAVSQISSKFGVPLVATNDCYYHATARKQLQDVLTCVRNKCTIKNAGFLRAANAERYLKSIRDLEHLFNDLPQALHRTVEISEWASGFSLDQLRYEYPNEICPSGKNPTKYLLELVMAGAKRRYPSAIPEKVQKMLDHELELIKELSYEKYFLTCYDIVKFATERGILCQGRGAAANSAVCFVLGITAVDPEKIDMLFARFISKERSEPPDIDIDFEHERREEVIQYIYQKYGRARAGLTAEVVTYRHRSAIREVTKAMGFSLPEVDRLAKSIHRWSNYCFNEVDLRSLGFDPTDTALIHSAKLASELLGFPRHLSQHVGGFVISEQPLIETVPILNASMPDRTIIEWNKDDIEALGMLKIDILGLGMLSCIRKALQYLNDQEPSRNLTLASIPAEDSAVYDMICRADTIGVFQIESRAQMSMLPRLKPRCFYDLVIEVAIVRPGPIKGQMVHPFLRRRNGTEKVVFPDQKVAAILQKTLGVPIFQEQAMRLAIELAHFAPGEAEKLRRAMAAWKRNEGMIAKFKERIVKGMLESGYPTQFAETCVEQIKGFSEYGFPESHAASFALLVYASAWIKCHHPAVFAAALLNSQPMGFYQPAQIVSDAKAHGVEVLPIDINHSSWDATLEARGSGPEMPVSGFGHLSTRSSGCSTCLCLRLGMRMVHGIMKCDALIIIDFIKAHGRVESIWGLWIKIRAAGFRIRKATLNHLARADAFRSMGLDRHQALWEIEGLPDEPLPLDNFKQETEKPNYLPQVSEQLSIFEDYRYTGLSLRAHPLSLIREQLNDRFVSTAEGLKPKHGIKEGTIVSVAGMVLVRQRPGTAKGFTFLTLEDETGMVNLVLKPKIFEQFRNIAIGESLILALGRLERLDQVVYITVDKLESLSIIMTECSTKNSYSITDLSRDG